MHALAEGETLKIGLPRNNFCAASVRGSFGSAGRRHRYHATAGHGLSTAGPGSFLFFGLFRTVDTMRWRSLRKSAAADSRSDAVTPRLDRRGGSAGFGDAAGHGSAERTCLHLRAGPVHASGSRSGRHKPGVVLHLEYFAAEPPTQDLTASSFRVKLAKSGTTIRVDGQSDHCRGPAGSGNRG